MFKWFNKNKEIKKPEDKVEELKNLKINLEQPKEKISDFIIEYYPLTKRYYPKYKNKYIYKHPSTGIMVADYSMSYVEYAYSEEDADKIIELFKEQQFKKNVIIIKR